MLTLNLPSFETNIRLVNGAKQIFDPLRRRYVALTPEEWVRQHFIHYLIHDKGYPTALLGNEITLSVNHQRLRCDSLLFAHDMTPRMMIEYKAPSVEITQHVFDQIRVYNTVVHAPYLTVSNGIAHYCLHIDHERQMARFLPEIPAYDQLL